MVPQINEIQGSPKDSYLNQSQGTVYPILSNDFLKITQNPEIACLILNHLLEGFRYFMYLIYAIIFQIPPNKSVIITSMTDSLREAMRITAAAIY